MHAITKEATGQLKTFRVISVTDGTTMVISPPIVSGDGGSDVELQYQNCEKVTSSDTAAITFLNTDTAYMNPFWHRDALEILPGKYAIPSGAGSAIMRGSTDQGVELVLQKTYNQNTMKIHYRLDTFYGVVNKQPEMTGIILWNQVS